MTPQLNSFYGILTNGDNKVRKTTTETPKDRTVRNIVAALMPIAASPECRRALAELYIRIIQTSKPLQLALNKVDPINSYKLQSFCETFTDKNIIEKIVENLKALGLPEEENSALPFDYIKNALRVLLERLNGLA